MNAAARALTQGPIASTNSKPFVFTSQMFGIFLLIAAVLASAVGVVYIKELNRQLFTDLQSLRQARDELQVQTNQLLLEQNTWAASTRVQGIAQQKLGMGLPTPKNIILLAIEPPKTRFA